MSQHALPVALESSDPILGVLVLSALGCGAFNNPPSHVAEIFRAVIQQYGSLFQSITFAIVEDHNSKAGLHTCAHTRIGGRGEIAIILGG